MRLYRLRCLFICCVGALVCQSCSDRTAGRRPEIEVVFSGDGCGCAVSSYRISVIDRQAGGTGPCLLHSASSGPGPFSMRAVPFESNGTYELVVFGFCESSGCAACEARTQFRAQNEARVSLSLRPVTDCATSSPLPGSFPTCQGSSGDGGMDDAGVDAGPDAPPDAPREDGSEGDAIQPDAAPPDARPDVSGPDAIVPDAPVPDAGVLEQRILLVSGEFIVPLGVRTLIIQAWGAGGGGGFQRTLGKLGIAGGGGGYSQAEVSVGPKDLLLVEIGQGGEGGQCGSRGGRGLFDGGDGGDRKAGDDGADGEGPREVGGAGGLGRGSWSADGGDGGFGGGGGGDSGGGGGGAATTVSRENDKDLLVVAGGGGGGGGGGIGGIGGPGCAVDGAEGGSYAGGGGGGGGCIGDFTEDGSGPSPGRANEANSAGEGGAHAALIRTCSASAGKNGKVIISYVP